MANLNLVRLPPDPTDPTVAKRTWERAMGVARGDIRELREADLWISSLLQDRVEMENLEVREKAEAMTRQR